mgnify:CR=1 FL=1
MRDRDMELSNLQIERDSYMGNDVILLYGNACGEKGPIKGSITWTVTKLEGVRFAEEI